MCTRCATLCKMVWLWTLALFNWSHGRHTCSQKLVCVWWWSFVNTFPKAPFFKLRRSNTTFHEVFFWYELYTAYKMGHISYPKTHSEGCIYRVLAQYVRFMVCLFVFFLRSRSSIGKNVQLSFSLKILLSAAAAAAIYLQRRCHAIIQSWLCKAVDALKAQGHL